MPIYIGQVQKLKDSDFIKYPKTNDERNTTIKRSQ